MAETYGVFDWWSRGLALKFELLTIAQPNAGALAVGAAYLLFKFQSIWEK